MFPQSSKAQTLVAVFEVVGLHIHGGVLATGAVDVLAIGASLGIKFQSFDGFVGQALRHLPVVVSVDGFVTRVGDEKLRLVLVFRRCVLPSVGMLQVEVGVALHLANRQAKTIVLAHIAIAAHTRGVLHHQSAVALLRDDVDDSGYGIRAIERRRGPFHNLNLLDVVRVDESQVVLSAHVAMNALAIDEDEDVGVAQSVHLHLRPHVALVEGKRRRQTREDILQGTASIVLEHLSGDHFRLHGRIFQ